MVLKIYNTLTRKKEIFKPIKDGHVGMYVCGPTVNGVPHLGHARQQVTFDVIRKYLRYLGYKVKFVSNITDIDDKIINKANELGEDIKKFAENNIKEHTDGYKEIGSEEPDVRPKATEYIKEMIELVKKLEEKGYTYVIEGDGVYYDISKFKGYGKLSHQDVNDLQAGARIAENEMKKNPHDFVLWKSSKPGEPKWESPWGEGRPGWHIECSAMSYSILGIPFDIHGGGQDLIFPHHEDEIAQSEAAYGKKLANYWVHNGFVNVNKEKMSKSLGNFTTIKDVLEKYDGKTIRYFVISKHYRSPIDFSDDLLEQAKNSIDRINEFFLNINNYSGNGAGSNINKLIQKTKKEFEKAMNDDFETSAALAAVFDFIREVNSGISQKKISQAEKALIIHFFKEIDKIMGFLKTAERVPAEILELVEKRDKVRAEKDWKLSDKLRDEISSKGYSVKDTSEGSVVKKI